MASGFQFQVYSNVVRGSTLVAGNWGDFAEGLKFESNAFGGYGACSFTLKVPFALAHAYVEGWGGSKWIGDRLRIVDPYGVVCYEGMIYTLNLKMGTETLSRDLGALFNVARVEFNVPQKNGSINLVRYYDDATSRAAYGKKVYNLQLPGAYPKNTNTPVSVARRFVKQNLNPGRSQSKHKGGNDLTLALEVSCVGMVTPGLEWRYAFSNLATSVDTAQIIKDMLGANPTAEGSNGAGRGPTGSGWVEVLNSTNTLGYGQQFISTNLSNIANSGTLVERNNGSGSSRIDIVKAVALLGSVNDKRMLFQVWDDGSANSGKGIAYFQEMSEAQPFTSTYAGYYDYANQPVVLDLTQHQIPLWRVRAGKWITTLGLDPNSSYATIYDDPRTFWIEATQYDADAALLTLSSASMFDIKKYIGRLIGGKKVIRGTM